MKLAEVATAELSTPTMVGIVPFISDGRCLFTDEPAIPRIACNGDAKEDAAKGGAKHFGLESGNMGANPFLGWQGQMKGQSGSYGIEVYAVLVKDGSKLHGTWLTRSEFDTKGPKSQTAIADKIFDKVEAYLKE